MSGIVGVASLDGAEVDRSLLEGLTASLHHRDGDRASVWAEGGIGLGQMMPAAPGEPESEARPSTLDGRVWLVADARVDARGDLARRLAASEHAGRTAPDDLAGADDAELLLRAYRTWGERCVEHLLGDFAFAIWDGPGRRLFCARDQLGIHPLFYALTGRSLVVANDLDCVRRHPEVPPGLDDLAIADFLLFGFNLEADTTPYAAIRALPPGHRLSWTPGGPPRVERYWELTVPPETGHVPDEEHLVRFDRVLHAAVADRLRTDRAGVLMSGGIDSTRVAAAAAGELADPGSLRAHTIVYDHLMPDEERRFAAIAAEALGIPIEFHPADAYELFAGWDDPGARTPEPSPDPLSKISDDLLRAAAAHTDVVLTGYDGDVLCRAWLAPHFRGLVRSLRLRRAVSDFAWCLGERGALPPLGVRTRVRQALQHRRAASTLPPWIRPELVARLDLRARWQEHVAPRRPVGRPVRADAVNSLTGPSLREVLKSWHPAYTGSPLALRHPLLDLRVVECVLSLPPVPWCVNKTILRRSAAHALPDAIVRRPKAPLVSDPVGVRVERELVRPPRRSGRSPLEDYVATDRLPPLHAVPTTELLWPRLWVMSLDHWLDGL